MVRLREEEEQSLLDGGQRSGTMARPDDDAPNDESSTLVTIGLEL